jgi:trk system potassium uptake protein TrkH
MGFDRHMADGEIIKRLLRYGAPYKMQFVGVFFIMLFSIVYDLVSPLLIGHIIETVQEQFELNYLLMLVGGSPGSTAGGMKTTTLAVLIGCAFAVFRKRQSVQFFGRRIGEDVVFTAATLALLYGSLSLGGAVFLSFYEGLPFLTCLFETASAVATVGLSLGVTPQLSLISKLILILLMFLGRVGGLTLIYAALSGQRQVGKLPLDRITVG